MRSPLILLLLFSLSLSSMALPLSSPTPLRAASPFFYGQHVPQGVSAVSYMYGTEGLWRETNGLEYKWNYYSQFATSDHPFDLTDLVKYADGKHLTTARDANGYILFDFNRDLQIDVPGGGGAFFEHNGRGKSGEIKGNPFTQFWFDDNWVCRYMSQAYAMTQPNGLYDCGKDFTRWKPVGGGVVGFSPYSGSSLQPDQLALNGLWYFAQGNVGEGLARWNDILSKSGAVYVNEEQRFDYRNLHETYHLGLFKILTDQLLYDEKLPSDMRQKLLDHSVSQRSQILTRQEKRVTTTSLVQTFNVSSDNNNNNNNIFQLDASSPSYLGWRSDWSDDNSLINAESIAVSTLSLSVRAYFVFEAGKSPMSSDSGYFLRPHNVLSADISAGSAAGYMTFGPYWNLPDQQQFNAEFLLRIPNLPSSSTTVVATIDVHDATSQRILATRNLVGADFAGENGWSQFDLYFQVEGKDNKMEFRTYWHAAVNMDVAAVRVQ